MRRRLDEAEHLAAAASAARGRAEQREAERRVQHITRGIRAELALAIRTLSAPERLGVPPVPEPRGLELERVTIAARRKPAVAEAGADHELARTLAALRAELDDLRTIAEREQAGHDRARAQAAQLERELHQYATRSVRAYDAIQGLREELEAVRLAAARPADEQPAGPSPAAEESAAEESPREEPPPEEPPPEEPPPEEPPPPAVAPAGPVEAERLEAALSRLREAAPAAPEPGGGAGAGDGRPVRGWPACCARCSSATPLPPGVWCWRCCRLRGSCSRGRWAYDLLLTGDGCVQVTVAGGYLSIERHPSPRPPDAVQFSVTADLTSLARFVATGRSRRRLRRSGARLSGDRTAARALPALAAVPLSISELVGAGVQLDPPLALSVAGVDDRSRLDQGRALHDRLSASGGIGGAGTSERAATVRRRRLSRVHLRSRSARRSSARRSRCSRCSTGLMCRERRSGPTSGR